MTLRIEKSQVPRDFEVAVAAFVKESKDWRAHIAKVNADERTGVLGIDRHVAYKQPRASSLVESAVNEDGVADYVLVDDSAMVLLTKKKRLIGITMQIEAMAIEQILPSGKQRAFEIRESDIRQKESVIGAGLMERGFVASVVAAVGISIPVDVVAELKKRRSNEDQTFLDEQCARREKIKDIYRAAAQVMADIEDLTVDNIDSWKIPDLLK